MRKYIKMMIVLSTIFFAVHFNHAKVFAGNMEVEKYERDYLSKVFDSENGLEGTTANCICQDKEGFLWFGGYTGLYRYDGSEFKKYLMDGRALPINDLVQDEQGRLWIGTNGEGIYCFEKGKFSEYDPEEEARGASVINKLYLDSTGILWVGSKAGLFSLDTRENAPEIKIHDQFSNVIIQDIGELSDGRKIIIQKTGEVFLLENQAQKGKELPIPLADEEGVPRCCYGIENDEFYLGMTGNILLKVTAAGKIECRIDGKGLSSFNEIYKFQDGEYWICSDTGIGILKEDKMIKLDLDLTDSIEEGCEDYQGNFWFVSSRQGVMQIYENYFSNLGAYWNITQTVNSIQPYRNQIYVGCDDGLYCYEGKKQVRNRLVRSCSGQRIRQIYLDNDNHLWISTYQNGIKKMDEKGEVTYFNVKNSGLETNKIRCIWQKKDKEFLIGTEEGLYLLDKTGNIRKYTKDDILNTKRILDIKECRNGQIYAATDGYGIYEIQDEKVVRLYSKQQGLLSNVAMKIVPSETMEGVWIVTGEGISFIDQNQKVKNVTGISVANSLDMLLTGDGKAAILAGNGFFQLEEKDLLKENISYLYLNKQDGLPVDFTANARNTMQGSILYMCGTSGAVSIDLNARQKERPLKLYVNAVTEDGENQEFDKDNIVFSASAHRINLDIRMINFVPRNIYASYCLSGMDKDWTQIKEESTDTSYTNLPGGNYTYHYKVYDSDSDECIAELSVSFQKKYMFWEQLRVRVLVGLLSAGCLVLLFAQIVEMRERKIKKQCYIEFLQEKEAEISELAYKDLVTGVYNRNYFEKEKKQIDLRRLYALVSVSINHMEYFKNKYGIFPTENILRTGVAVLQKCAAEEIKICRVSENIFYLWFMEPVQLETYIYDIKEMFQKKGEKDGIPYSFSVGAIYNNTVGKENIEELIDRCGKMRLLDEKHAEAKFIEGKMKML